MKRFWAILFSVILLFVFPGCKDSTNSDLSPTEINASTGNIINPTDLQFSDFSGGYKFLHVSVMSALSSSTIEYQNEQMAGTTYTISNDLFEIRSKDSTFTVEKPRYEASGLSNIEKDHALNQDIRTFVTTFDVDEQYTILKANGDKAYYKIYTSSKDPDQIWLADYNDNTQDGTEILVQSVNLLARE
jgi:hypothetical protein